MLGGGVVNNAFLVMALLGAPVLGLSVLVPKSRLSTVEALLR